MENDNERWLGAEERVYDSSGDLVGFVRPYKANKYSAEHNPHWAWRSAFVPAWTITVKNPTRRVRHKELAQALVIAGRYGGY